MAAEGGRMYSTAPPSSVCTPSKGQPLLWTPMAVTMDPDREPQAKEASGAAPRSLNDCLESSAWSISRPRLFQVLAPSRRVLVAGCGGGYDVLSGLPLFFALRREGKEVLLANLSFTDLNSLAGEGTAYCDGCVRVAHDMQTREGACRSVYFPELYLSRWFKEAFGEDVPVFSFKRQVGVTQLSLAYERICAEYGVDALVLVDGGTDSLMFGWEEDMGTPVEDQTSIAAVASLTHVPLKLLVAIGFGVDAFHGVSHGLFLENVASLERSGGYLGCFSVQRASVEGALYAEAYTAVAAHMQPSIVCASITDAMKGHFGDYHSTERTAHSKLFINPLMPICWTFDVVKVAEKIPYLTALCSSTSAYDVMAIISRHVSDADAGTIRKAIPLPM